MVRIVFEPEIDCAGVLKGVVAGVVAGVWV